MKGCKVILTVLSFLFPTHSHSSDSINVSHVSPSLSCYKIPGPHHLSPLVWTPTASWPGCPRGLPLKCWALLFKPQGRVCLFLGAKNCNSGNNCPVQSSSGMIKASVPAPATRDVSSLTCVCDRAVSSASHHHHEKKNCKLKEKTQIQLPEVLFPPAPLPFPHSFLLETIVALIRRIRAVFMSLYLSHLWVPVIPIHLRYGKSRHLSWCSTVPHCVGTDSLGRAVHSQKATFGSCG